MQGVPDRGVRLYRLGTARTRPTAGERVRWGYAVFVSDEGVLGDWEHGLKDTEALSATEVQALLAALPGVRVLQGETQIRPESRQDPQLRRALREAGKVLRSEGAEGRMAKKP